MAKIKRKRRGVRVKPPPCKTCLVFVMCKTRIKKYVDSIKTYDHIPPTDPIPCILRLRKECYAIHKYLGIRYRGGRLYKYTSDGGSSYYQFYEKEMTQVKKTFGL